MSMSKPLRNSLIPTNMSHWTIYCSFKIIFEIGIVCLIDWNSNPMFYGKPLLQKNVQYVMNYISAQGSSGSDG